MTRNTNHSQCSNTFMLLFFLTLVIITKCFYAGNRLPLWTWECVNDKCVPLKPNVEGKLQSLITCNMLCASMQLWPQPTGSVSLSASAVPVRVDFFNLKIFHTPSEAIFDHVQDAFDLMLEDLQKLESKVRGYEEWRTAIVRVFVNGTSDPRMRVGTDESYRLSITPEKNHQLFIDISAKSFCGLRHGFETLAQLVWMDPYAGSLMILEAAKIEDAPRFGYRGLMLDTARTFFPVSELLRIVDAMAVNKLNTLHWHVSDSQAFPLQLIFAPQVTTYGAHGARAVYSAEDVRVVVRHARLRGVRVLMEVDAPAHLGRAWSWGPQVHIGELSVCFDSEPWTAYCAEPPCGQLNPKNNHMYTFLEKTYAEIIKLTGVNDIFHIGGDDVSEHCWNQQFGNHSATALWAKFTRTALQRLKIVNNNRMPNLTIMWMSPFSESIKGNLKEFLPYLGLQSRNSPKSPVAVSGIRTILSTEDAWDLNDGLGAWYDTTNGAPYNNWQRVYDHRPWSRSSEDVVGGEATVWSARLGPELSARVWPRAAALAERLWSDGSEGATRLVHARLDVHRARMIARGHVTAPVWSMWCSHNPLTCL